MESASPLSWTFVEENWPDRWPMHPDWPGFKLDIDGEPVDFASAIFTLKKQRTHLFEGFTERTATAHLPGGRILNIHSKQFAHLAEEGGEAMRFSLTPLNFSGKIGLCPLFDFSADCLEKEEGEVFFVETSREADHDSAAILLETADGQRRRTSAFRFTIYQDGEEVEFSTQPLEGESSGRIGHRAEVEVEPMQETVLFKFDGFLSEKKRPRSRPIEQVTIQVNRLFVRGFQQLLQEQAAGWSQIWRSSELAGLQPSETARPVFLNLWRLLEGWLQPDYFSKKEGGIGHDEATALQFLCEKASPVFLKKTLIDRHLRSPKAMESMAFGYATGQFLTRAGHPRAFLEKGLEAGITACRFWSESGNWRPLSIVEKTIENLSLAIAAAKRTDPEMWRSLIIRFRFEEKREMRRWAERLREN